MNLALDQYDFMQQRRVAELETLLRSAQELRPTLLKQYGAVPECVLDFCNRARAATAKPKPCAADLTPQAAR